MRFRHSGKLGDIIYALLVLKACRRSELFLNATGTLGFGAREAAAILPLVRAQPYVMRAKVWEGELFDYDLDEFRLVGDRAANLADAHLRAVGLSGAWRDEPWLTVTAKATGLSQVIFARSLAHRGPPGFWEECHRALGPMAAFAGSDAEYGEFCERIGPVTRAMAWDLLDLAGIIAGASLFVGNQSCPYAIAEGLKVASIQETFAVANCVFERPDALYVRSAADLALIEPFARQFADRDP